MRSKEQFKAYVYEKADVARSKNKKLYTAWVRGTVAFSLLVVVGGALFYGNGGSVAEDGLAPAFYKSASAEAEVYGTGREGDVPKDGCMLMADSITVNEADLAKANTESIVEGYSDIITNASSVFFMYSSSMVDLKVAGVQNYVIAENASAYSGDLQNIDFSQNVALVLSTQHAIVGWDVSYGDSVIVVTLHTSEEKAEKDSYTVLLDRSKATGQKIEIVSE